MSNFNTVTQLSAAHIFCVEIHLLRVEQFESLLFQIPKISVNFQMVSVSEP